MSKAISVDQILGESSKSGRICDPSIKSLIFLFIIVIFVLSTSFNNYVIGSFKGAIRDNKETTSFGVMVQATCIVILYALVGCLEKYEVL